MTVPNIHLRGVPPKVHAALKRRADANGRSVNAEILAIVEEEMGRAAERARFLRELRRLQREVRSAPDATPPEQIIREARDERTRRL